MLFSLPVQTSGRMRRALLLVAAAATLVLLWSSNTAAAATIPGTTIQVLELDPSSKEVWQGTQTNFSWVVSNPTGPRYRISLTANGSDSDFSLEAFPANFTLGRDQFLVVRLNVTAPRDGAARTARIYITFSTISPVVSTFGFNATV